MSTAENPVRGGDVLRARIEQLESLVREGAACIAVLTDGHDNAGAAETHRRMLAAIVDVFPPTTETPWPK